MPKTSRRVLFFGTDDFSAYVLNTLIDLKADIVGVVTRADKPQGHKQKIVFSPVKELALKHNIPVLQPIKLKDSIKEVLSYKPDLIITCSYGRIIPEEIINYPRFHCINIHPSLLPKYRGASPMQATIRNRDFDTGVTILYMTKDLDNGNILFTYPFLLTERDTFTSLKEMVKKAAAELLYTHYDQFFDTHLKSIPQDESKATFTTLIKHEDEQIDWNQSAKDIDAFVRSLYDKPIAYTNINGQIVKIHQTKLTKQSSEGAVPGTILDISANGILVATKTSAINIVTIQLAGKKPMPVKMIINGHLPFKKGDLFKNY